MDYMLPDDDTMEIMRREFDKLKRGSGAQAFALSDGEVADGTPKDTAYLAYISTAFLLLYFVKHLRYNTGYGIQIFDTDRSLERLQPVGRIFRQLNDLG